MAQRIKWDPERMEVAIGRILGPSVLFIHFLEYLFAPIMGRFDEPNMGLPILGSQYLVNYIFWVIKY